MVGWTDCKWAISCNENMSLGWHSRRIPVFDVVEWKSRIRSVMGVSDDFGPSNASNSFARRPSILQMSLFAKSSSMKQRFRSVSQYRKPAPVPIATVAAALPMIPRIEIDGHSLSNFNKAESELISSTRWMPWSSLPCVAPTTTTFLTSLTQFLSQRVVSIFAMEARLKRWAGVNCGSPSPIYRSYHLSDLDTWTVTMP